jgi:type VI protein secretion system component Hcp
MAQIVYGEFTGTEIKGNVTQKGFENMVPFVGFAFKMARDDLQNVVGRSSLSQSKSAQCRFLPIELFLDHGDASIGQLWNFLCNHKESVKLVLHVIGDTPDSTTHLKVNLDNILIEEITSIQSYSKIRIYYNKIELSYGNARTSYDVHLQKAG